MTFMWRALSSPSLSPTATLTASSSNEAIGRANSQSPLCYVQAAKKEVGL